VDFCYSFVDISSLRATMVDKDIDEEYIDRLYRALFCDIIVTLPVWVDVGNWKIITTAKKIVLELFNYILNPSGSYPRDGMQS
jgi:hypothetical protein